MDTPATAGEQLRHLRRQARLSQLDLALITGVSQRHLSCLETGRAKPSPGTLHNLLTALEAPLDQRNRVFLAAGYAPRYNATPLTSPGMAAIREAVSHVLHANNPAPAILLDSQWQVLAANASTAVLFELVGIPSDSAEGLNLLTTLLQPGGLGDHLINADEIRTLAWQRATREALGNPELAALLARLPAPASTELPTDMPPLVLTRIRSSRGELSFLSTFTTFGMPQDITLSPLRIEHLIPADDATWQVMRAAYADYAALVL
ncbi:transcriptional regulator [Pseudomonas azotoformans]|uniref:Transcriptional regulator n=1 Tax=Pseudomonas azotoformans TaxID=47878 RepID=A0A1V2JGM3_PSEAZ|nr:helix-turn-helix domain-containing protein [Pseudomonas azotoformans]OIN46058.1 transcriptional regulator [Pseudomonas azotoformans]ONH44514.1 transcriptional regulator [Pseudomonas azotoformans]SDN25270.1 Helix-turn-helix domain-containing protein [Pseudomonas azotoformans]